MKDIKNKSNQEIIKFIQSKLTEKYNGFRRHSGIPDTEDNGKPLIYLKRGIGVVFNNKVG